MMVPVLRGDNKHEVQSETEAGERTTQRPAPSAAKKEKEKRADVSEKVRKPGPETMPN